ncbi:MAG TPA: hypothetical protein VFA10_21910 [Ktedonobacteraceae bacterium]|jgi:hypothetical protein|nr:hypothetical protein [Ktedonobacteraceae bacterium]
MTTDQKKPINVFLFYAPEDAWLLQEFGKHLDALKNLGVISSWCSQRIGPGTGWAEVIEANLEAASIILPLVSTNFLACAEIWYTYVEGENCFLFRKCSSKQLKGCLTSLDLEGVE